MTLRRHPLVFALLLVMLIISASIASVHANQDSEDDREPVARQDATATPAQLLIPSETPTTTPTVPPTRTPTVWQERARAEALNDNTNIRSEPDITASRVAQIFPGTAYDVLGKRFEWYQIVYPDAPTGFAWVHQSVVRISGNADLIPELAPEDIPTQDPAVLAEQQTLEAIQDTPGAAITLTAQMMITPTGVFTADPAGESPTPPGTPPPTLSPPAQTPTWMAIPKTSPAAESSEGGLPPIVPILALAGVGLLGLLVSVLRRV